MFICPFNIDFWIIESLYVRTTLIAIMYGYGILNHGDLHIITIVIALLLIWFSGYIENPKSMNKRQYRYITHTDL